MTEWLNETLYPGWGQRFKVLKIIARERSAFQDIVIADTETHGRVLLLDGCVQITEADEFVYQEMLVHVPLLAHGAAHRVLIIGAGDGGVLRRVLQHRSVQQATMVEIDEAVVRLSKQCLPSIGGNAWADPRAELIIGDGINYVANSAPGAYDVIIVDSTDPIGVGETLFTEDFYTECARVLGTSGIIVNQAGVPFMQAEELAETSARRARVFNHVTAYLAAVPTYVGGFMALGIASNSSSFLQFDESELARRAEKSGVLGATSYWSPAVHVSAFQLPPYIAQRLPRLRAPDDART